MEPQIRFCTSADGTRIGYATYGEEAGLPIVFVSGWGHIMDAFWANPWGRRFVEVVARHRRVVEYDRRGIGASQREVDDLSVAAQVADLAAVVDTLDLVVFDLVSWDDGGAMAVSYAAQYPDRVARMVLCSPYSVSAETKVGKAAAQTAQMIRTDWSLARRALATVSFPSGPADMQRWWSRTARESMSQDIAARHYEEFIPELDVTAELPKVRAQTLVLSFREVGRTPVEASKAVATSIPDARLALVDGSYDAWVDRFDDLVRPFLDEGRPDGRVAQIHEAGAFRTILFTDVEGSTALTERLGDAKARELLREHERIVREALKAHGGSEVKTLGDGFMASFSSATKALDCAIAMQSAFAERNESAEEPIKVRIGLNAGEPIAEDDPGGRGDLFGTAVNMAARIAAKAEGGQTLASNVVQELAAGKGFTFTDEGEATLKGFDKPVRLHEVRWHD